LAWCLVEAQGQLYIFLPKMMQLLNIYKFLICGCDLFLINFDKATASPS